MRRTVIRAAILVLVFVAVAPATALKYSLLDKHGITSDSLGSMLQAGSLLLIDYDDQGEMRMITSAIAVNAPPEQLLAAIHDYEHFPEFMPSTRKVEVVSREGNEEVVAFENVFKFSILKQTVRYTNRNHLVPGKGYWWELEDGDLAASFGSWEVVPLDGGKRSAAVYSVYTDIRSVSAIVKYFIDTQPGMDVAFNASTCVLVLKAIRDRVESGAYADHSPHARRETLLTVSGNGGNN